MRAALAHLADAPAGGGRVAVLGEMAELGPEPPPSTGSSAPRSAAGGVSELVAVGPLAAELRRRRGRRRGGLAADADEAAEAAGAARAAPGDVVLDQGLASGGTRGRRGETTPPRWPTFSSRRSSR